MHEYYPLLVVGAIIGAFTVCFVTAFALMKNKKQAIGFDRRMKDGELIRRLLVYAKPFRKNFAFVGFLLLFSIAYDVLAPVLVGKIEELVKADFPLDRLFTLVTVYASILVVSLVCTYAQSILLQKTGQRILTEIREDLFHHIESLSHDQLSKMPVGKLVTREVNDTNAVSVLFINLLPGLAKNAFVVIGVLVAMLCLNLELTLMVLCFVPFVVLFTVIFRKFSRRAHRKVKDGTTDINTYLSENLSGMKITQIFCCEDRKMREFAAKNKQLGRAKHEQTFVFS
ncbi:MAG: ABC transporter ATP-binding protein, partial [Clostridiales bacterium]|nr:ABC transporter ATP-binding protein [Clostridiales bacterium]